MKTGKKKHFKNKKRFGLNQPNKIFKQKQKSKDMAVVFDEKERHSFLTGIINAKKKRKEFFENKKREQEKNEFLQKNRLKRKQKKETIEKYKHVIEDTKNEDKFLKDFEKEKIQTTVEELKNSKNQKVIIKTSFLNI